jgi:hypothetical protein
MWADYIVPGAEHKQLYSMANLGTLAFVIEDRRGIPSNHVVLKASFFTAVRSEQDIVLIHELLHVFSAKNDENLARDLGVTGGSPGIQDWLRKDCGRVGRLPYRVEF